MEDIISLIEEVSFLFQTFLALGVFFFKIHFLLLGEGRNSEKWYVANDGVIRETTREYVLKQPAYLLFYEKMNESG